MEALAAITVAILFYVAYGLFRAGLINALIESYKKGKTKSEDAEKRH